MLAIQVCYAQKMSKKPQELTIAELAEAGRLAAQAAAQAAAAAGVECVGRDVAMVEPVAKPAKRAAS